MPLSPSLEQARAQKWAVPAVLSISLVVVVVGNRYCTIGFDPIANLDDGDMWPISFALINIGPDEESRIIALVRKAVS